MYCADRSVGNLQHGVGMSQLHGSEQCDLPDGVPDAGVWVRRCGVLEEGVGGQGEYDVGADGESGDGKLLHFARSVGFKGVAW